MYALSKEIQTPAQLGTALKERRIDCGESQSSIAKKAGISRAWMVALEQGAPGVSVGVILRVLNVLGLSMTVASANAEETSSRTAKSKIQPVDLNQFLASLRHPNK